MWVGGCIAYYEVKWGFSSVEGGCEKSAMYWSKVCESGGVLGGGDECDPCEGGFEFAFVISVGVSTVED